MVTYCLMWYGLWRVHARQPAQPPLGTRNSCTEKHPFIDKQSQIAERKTTGEQGSRDRSKEAA